MWRAIAGLAAWAVLSGCELEKTVVYAERIAVLPDRSGYLTKEIRSWDKTKTELVLCEVRKAGNQDLFVVALDGFDDVKFRSRTIGDTIHLYHGEAGLEKNLAPALGKAAFPVRFHHLSGPDWLSTGIIEGDAVFYAEDKWPGLLDLMGRE